jgi:hypothetical protein
MTTISSLLAAALQAGSTLAPAPIAKPKFNALEISRITAAAELPDGDENSIPTFWKDIIVHGKKINNTRVLLETAVADAGKDIEDTSRMWISDSLARDVLSLNLGHQGNISYSECNRGLSIMAVAPVTAIEMHAMKIVEEDFDRTTFVTSADVKAVRKGPPVLDLTYGGIRKLLNNYRRLLLPVVGAQSSHLRFVVEIREELVNKEQMWSVASQTVFASIVWLIFLDARTVFSTSHDDDNGNPPESNLGYLVIQMKASQAPDGSNVPFEMLTTTRVPNAPNIQSGTTTGSVFGTDKPDQTTVNHRHNTIAADITKAALAMLPNLSIWGVVSASDKSLQFRDLIVGNAQCVDFQILGRCKNARCTFHHDPAADTAEAVERVAQLIAPVLAQMVAAGPPQKKKRRR